MQKLLITSPATPTFVFICWNIRTKLTNPVNETVICRTFQLRLLVQSLPRHRCYNSKILDQKLLVRRAVVTSNTKWNKSGVFLFIPVNTYLTGENVHIHFQQLDQTQNFIKNTSCLSVHVALLRRKEGKKKNKLYHFRPKITTHAIATTSFTMHFML